MVPQEIFESTQLVAGVKGLIFFGDRGHMLVYRRDGNTDRYPFYLDLPGGGAEPDESPFETFQREAKEEFALEIKPEAITYAKTYPSRFEPGKFALFLVAQLGATDATKIKFGDEGISYRIISVEDFLKAPGTIPDHTERVRDYLMSLQ